MRYALLIIVSLSAIAQPSAITSLSSFWDADFSLNGRIVFDHKGSAHAIAFGLPDGVERKSTVFGTGFSSNDAHGRAGVSVAGELVNTSASFCYGVWVERGSIGNKAIITRTTGDYVWPDLQVRFNNGGSVIVARYTQVDNTQDSITVEPPGFSAGVLGLVWIAYDADAGQIKLAINDGAWSGKAGTVRSSSANLDFGHSSGLFDHGNTIGRAMLWNGYIPTDEERTAIYNSGNGRDQSYFGLSYTAPQTPLTITQTGIGVFADDATLEHQGLYWFRPFPLKLWSPALASQHGQYIWVRSEDHAGGGAGDAIYMGFSSSPSELPTSWSMIITKDTLSAADLSNNWIQMHTPHMEYDPVTGKIHLYHGAMRSGSDSPYEWATHVWTTSDLSSWEWLGQALPFGATIDGTRVHHTGYANVVRRGTGDWVAISLLNTTNTFPGSRSGTWASTDGITWSFVAVTDSTDIAMPYQALSRPFMTGDYILQYYSNGLTNGVFVSPRGVGYFDAQYPQMFIASGVFTGSNGDWLQDVRAYEENGHVWIYAKWSYQEPSTIRLYEGPLASAIGPASCVTVTDTASAKTRSYSASPYTAFTYPLYLRIYFATSEGGLAASTTYCENKGTEACSLDLSGMTHYQLRLYDFSGRSVSQGTPGTL